ncbi:MAG TPA: 30S ribosomal protein S11 [Elusimicrobia bacterium]|nr:30S ribosomal protein S11 [Elusimicrobiota bacterium]
MADNEKPQEKPKAEAAPAAAQTPAAPAPRQESGSHPAAGPKGGPKAGGKRSWKTVTFAKVFIQSSFNNTIVTITDDRGAVLCWASAGATGFKGTKKGTPFAAQMTSAKVAKRAVELGVKQVAVFVKGPGPGRETAIRALHSSGLQVLSLKDVSPLPHNGCRPPKQRRV